MAVFFTKSKDQILSQILNSLERNAGITSTTPGSIARAFAEVVSDQIGDLYTILRYNVDQTMISRASGRNLDLIGELYSVKRKQVTESIASDRLTANVIFSISKPYSRDITIPSGTSVFNDVSGDSTLQFMYNLTEDVTIAAASKRAYGRIVPAFSGQAYTASIGSLTRHNFIPPPGAIVSVQNIKEIHNQVDYESDENYRRRIIRSVKLYSAGTAEAIRLASLAVKGVRDVRIREATYGMGSCDVIVVPESNSVAPTIDLAVLEQLADYRPVGIKMNVRVAERVPVSVTANVILPINTSSSAASAVANQTSYFIRRYLNSFTIGDSLNVNTLKQQAALASDLISDLVVNSITVNGVEIPQENYQLQSERSFMSAGVVQIYPAIIGSSSSY